MPAGGHGWHREHGSAFVGRASRLRWRDAEQPTSAAVRWCSAPRDGSFLRLTKENDPAREAGKEWTNIERLTRLTALRRQLGSRPDDIKGKQHRREHGAHPRHRRRRRAITNGRHLSWKRRRI